MTGAIAAGSIWISGSTRLPGSLSFQRGPNPCGWVAVTSPRSAFEKEIEAAGWTFFFMAGEIKANVFGFDRQKTLRVALERLIANAKAQNCNCVEITQVTEKSFLKAPYVSVSAHPRHLQKGVIFSGR